MRWVTILMITLATVNVFSSVNAKELGSDEYMKLMGDYALSSLISDELEVLSVETLGDCSKTYSFFRVLQTEVFKAGEDVISGQSAIRAARLEGHFSRAYELSENAGSTFVDGESVYSRRLKAASGDLDQFGAILDEKRSQCEFLYNEALDSVVAKHLSGDKKTGAK